MRSILDDLEELYRERYYGFRNALVGIAGIDHHEAHDAVQEAFARAIRDRNGFRHEGSLDSWVWRIAVRVAFRSKRRFSPFSEVVLSEVILDSSSELDLTELELSSDLVEGIRSLSPRQRLMVFLRYFADLDYGYIAEECGVTVGTVGATLAQARSILRDYLDTDSAKYEASTSRKGLK
jgi:RNA polymerase sigma-70 factor (ECF subfamily)